MKKALCASLTILSLVTIAFAGPGPPVPTVVGISDLSLSFSSGALNYTWTDSGTGGTESTSYFTFIELSVWNESTSEWDEVGSAQDIYSDDYYETYSVSPGGGASHGISVNVAGMGLDSTKTYAVTISLTTLVGGAAGSAVGAAYGLFLYGDDGDPPPEPGPPPLPYPGDNPPIQYPLAPPGGPAGPGSFQSYKYTP